MCVFYFSIENFYLQNIPEQLCDCWQSLSLVIIIIIITIINVIIIIVIDYGYTDVSPHDITVSSWNNQACLFNHLQYDTSMNISWYVGILWTHQSNIQIKNIYYRLIFANDIKNMNKTKENVS